MDRTFECFAFASVPLALTSLTSAVICCAWPALVLPPLWTAGAATAMICERHRTTVWHALLASFGPLLALGAVVVGGLAFLIAYG